MRVLLQWNCFCVIQTCQLYYPWANRLSIPSDVIYIYACVYIYVCVCVLGDTDLEAVEAEVVLIAAALVFDHNGPADTSKAE